MTFEEWWKGFKYEHVADFENLSEEIGLLGATAKQAWDARQAEIDDLKTAIEIYKDTAEDCLKEVQKRQVYK